MCLSMFFFFFFLDLVFVVCFFFFFFSSRRRHTRSLRDWSSDVCSSDLPAEMAERVGDLRNGLGQPARHAPDRLRRETEPAALFGDEVADGVHVGMHEEIGRASCRERVEISVVAGSVEKKTPRQRVSRLP